MYFEYRETQEFFLPIIQPFDIISLIIQQHLYG